MNLTPKQAWNKAAYLLMASCGFPLDSKFKLYKRHQTFMEPLNQHKVEFALIVDHPVMIKNNKLLGEKPVEPVVGYDKQKPIKDADKFKLMRELIDILELQAKEQQINDADPEEFEWDIEA